MATLLQTKRRQGVAMRSLSLNRSLLRNAIYTTSWNLMFSGSFSTLWMTLYKSSDISWIRHSASASIHVLLALITCQILRLATFQNSILIKLTFDLHFTWMTVLASTLHPEALTHDHSLGQKVDKWLTCWHKAMVMEEMWEETSIIEMQNGWKHLFSEHIYSVTCKILNINNKHTCRC